MDQQTVTFHLFDDCVGHVPEEVVCPLFGYHEDRADRVDWRVMWPKGSGRRGRYRAPPTRPQAIRHSQQQDKPRSERARGQRPGAPGHGCTRRPRLEERREEHNPPPDACVCEQCGQPYAPNGAEESTPVKIDVKAHKRVISHPRRSRTCECPSSPVEIAAPPVPRLFVRTPYGISFWARFLFEHCPCFRPVRRVAAWFSSHGLAVSPGTLANS